MKTILISMLISAIVSLGAWFGIVKQETPFGIEIPSVIALFETSLASKITSSATSMTLVSGTDKDGNSISGKFGMVIDEGSSDEEFVIADCSGTACINMLRGISVTTGKTEVTALKKEHRRGASVKITDFPILANLQRLASGSEAFEDLLYYSETIGTTGFASVASSSNIASKYYVDYVGAGGFTAVNVGTSYGLKALGTSPETVGIDLLTGSGLYFSGGDLGIYASTSFNQLMINDNGWAYVGSGSMSFSDIILTTPLDETYGGLGTVSWDAGDMIYFSADNTVANIASGTEDWLLSMSGGFPAWVNYTKYQNRLTGVNTTWTSQASENPDLQNVASISVPANAMGANGLMEITVRGVTPNVNGTGGIQVKWNEGVIASKSIACSAGEMFELKISIWNKNATNSQDYRAVMYDLTSNTFSGVSIATNTIDTTVATTIEVLWDAQPITTETGTVRLINIESQYSD